MQMGKIVLTLVFASMIVFGIALIYFSSKLSLRYNAWTTSFRKKHPHINPPSTDRMRALNTKIMTWLFRFVGLYVVLYSLVLLSGIMR
jgi:uncharacterized membrane protein YjgN (DUF898 family)